MFFTNKWANLALVGVVALVVVLFVQHNTKTENGKLVAFKGDAKAAG